jgi:hypothetical protein
MSVTFQLKLFQCLTAAPENYDWRWARTIAYNIAKTQKHYKECTLRLVEVTDDYHFHNQVMRYSSGLNYTVDSQKRLDEELQYGYLILLDNPTPVYYLKIDVEGRYEWEDDRWEELDNLVREMQSTENVKCRLQDTSYYIRFVGDELKDHFVQQIEKFGLKVEPWVNKE